jgi:putative transcriptional regulator
MSTTSFQRIRAGLADALAHSQGKVGRVKLHTPDASDLDVAAIREKLKLTQEQFANLCGVSVATLRNWEQGRRRPTGPSRALLRLVDLEPKAALRVAHRRVA